MKSSNPMITWILREAKMKWVARGRPTISGYLIAQMDQLQQDRRQGLLAQLAGL